MKNIEEGLALMAKGEIDAYATNRQRLLDAAAVKPEIRVLADNFFAVEQAIAVQKGNAAALEIVNRFLDDAKASGLVAGRDPRSGG